MLSCTEDWDRNGRFGDIEMIKNAGFNSFYGGFIRTGGSPSAGKKNIDVRREIIGKHSGVVRSLIESGVHVVTYLWVGGFDRRYHEHASADKLKGEFPGSPAAWIKDVKDYVRACYNNPDWIEEVVNDVAAQMEEGDSEGIFFDVTVPLNHCICRHCQERLGKELSLDIDSLPLPAFSEPALDQAGGEDRNSYERIDFSNKAYRDYFKWRMDTYIDFFRQVRRAVEERTGLRPIFLTNSHSSRPEYIYCYLLSNGVLDGIYFEEGLNYPPNSLVYPLKIGAAAMPGAAPLVVTRVSEGIPTTSMMKVALAEGAAFGGYLTPWGFYIHESKELADAVMQYNKFFKKYEGILAAQADRASVAIIQSLYSDIFYGQGNPSAAKAMAIFLTDMHVPFEILLLEQGINSERLGKYTLVILPDAGMVSEADMTTLQCYMDSGGKIIATGNESLCFDENMNRRRHRPVHESLFYIDGCPEREHADSRIVGPDYFCEFAEPGGELADAVQQNAVPSILETNARVSVAINLTESDRDVLVHMVNFHVNMRLTQLFIRPANNISLRLRMAERIESCELLSPDIENQVQPLDFVQKNGYVELTVPQVVHYIIVRLKKVV
jgi:hypothetical protein